MRPTLPLFDVLLVQFLSTHSCGVRRSVAAHICTFATGFLSTHSCGVRLVVMIAQLSEKDFYPRTPVECDLFFLSLLTTCLYFYPRTPVECDYWTSGSGLGHLQFLSTHSCGVRQLVFIPSCCSKEFLSTHSCGVRLRIKLLVLVPV